MNKQHAIITENVFLSESLYESYLVKFEEQHGLIDHVVAHRCVNRKEEIILEIIKKNKNGN